MATTSLRWPDPALRFPGRTGSIAFASNRRMARSAVTAYPASRWRAFAAQGMALRAIDLLGPRLALGGSRPLELPVAEDLWDALAVSWQAALGPLDGLVVISRRQGWREGLSVLVHRDGVRRAFIRLRRDECGNERAMLALVAGHAESFQAPKVIAADRVHEWCWCALDPLPPRLHRPGNPPYEAIAAEVSSLVSMTPRPVDIPASWRGMHGDFTPWNLRKVGPGFLLLDWEDSGYGPPLADVVMYAATRLALSHRRDRTLTVPGADAARNYWLDVVRKRAAHGDRALNATLVEILRDMRVDG